MKFARVIIACVCLGLAIPVGAVSFAGVSFCGGTVTPGDPTDMNNQIGDMTLQAAVDQPAGIATCGKGYLLAKCGDHESANKIFDKCIAAGYVGAMIWKALQFENGNGVPKDLEAAAELLRRAALSDDMAYGTLGRLHYATVLHEGRGVARNPQEAERWFQRAAAEGNEEAQEFLRTGYHTGGRNGQGMGAGIPTAAAMAPLQQTAGIVSGPHAPETVAVPPSRLQAIALSSSPSASASPVPVMLQNDAAPPVITVDASPQDVSGLHLAPVVAENASSHETLGSAAWILAVAFLLGGLLHRPSSHLRIRLSGPMTQPA